MTQLWNALPVLVTPFVACLVIASLHCYMGLHVIRRGVIFVDLALAQCAALGAAVALLVTPLVYPHEHVVAEEDPAIATEAALAEAFAAEDGDLSLDAEEDGPAVAPVHEEEHERFGYAFSLGFALLGAVLLSVFRTRGEQLPHEAIIGIIFVVAAALTVLILSKGPHGHEEMEAMLVGSILFVSWGQVLPMVLLYVVLGAVHLALRRRFIAITLDKAAVDRDGRRVKLWDCLFYATFALMVTQSVSIAGVFVVFSYLIIPSACALLLARRFGAQLVVAWVVAAITTVVGLGTSAVGDMPTGASLVACFGAMLVLVAVVRSVLGKRQRGETINECIPQTVEADCAYESVGRGLADGGVQADPGR